MLTVVDVDPDRPTGHQVAAVGGGVQLVGGPAVGRQEERRIALDAQAAQLRPTDVDAGAVLLGADVRLCSASTVDCQRPTADAVLVSGYTSPGPPLNHRTRSAEDSPKRMPSRGSGTVQSPSAPGPQTRSAFRGQPLRSCPCGRFDQFEEHAQRPALAELITPVITDALPRATEGSTRGAPSSHAGPH